MEDGQKIRQWLQQKVQSYWETNQRVLLLSTIGSELRKEFPYSEHMPLGLKEFLSRWPIAQLVQHPTIRQKIGLIPLDVPILADPSKMFATSKVRLGDRLYVSEFWGAFTESITGRRFIYIDTASPGNILVQDVGGPSPWPSGKEVLPSDLGPLEANMAPAEKGSITREKIQAWLDRHGITPDQVRRLEQSVGRREQSLAEQIGKALLELSQDNQARISIPLDVVLSLFKQTR
jgi:hypothetical protein